MSFKIISAKYNCSDNTIDIEYSGKYDNSEILLRSHIGDKIYRPLLSGKKLIPDSTLDDLDGYSVSILSEELIFQCFFYVSCSPTVLCSPLPTLKHTYEKGSSDFTCHTIGSSETLMTFDCGQFLFISERVNFFDCKKTSSNERVVFNQQYTTSGVLVVFPTCDNKWTYGSLSMYVYDLCTKCLILKYEEPAKYLSEIFKIRYNCTLGLVYDKKMASELSIRFNGGVLPPVGTKLKNGNYKITLRKCAKIDADCEYREDCIELKVNCLPSVITTTTETCIEDANDIVSIERTEYRCDIKVTNKSNKLIKIRRNVLTSSDRSCSGDILIQGNEFTIFPAQSQIIDNESSGNDSKLEITYPLPSGDGECKSSICLPYCDLEVIGGKSDLKGPTVKYGISNGDKVLTFFNPLLNGVSTISVYTGGEWVSSTVGAGDYVAFKISGSKSIQYKLKSSKNEAIEFKSTFSLSTTSELKSGIPYTDFTTSEDGAIVTIKST